MINSGVGSVNNSKRFGRGVDGVVGGVGGANVKDKALGMARGVSMSITDMSSVLGSNWLQAPVLGS